MRERWIQLSAAMFSTLGACAANTPPSTAPVATTQTTQAIHLPPPKIERHEPVLPPSIVPVVQPTAPPVRIQPHPVAPANIATTQPGPIDDKVAYAIGYSAGRRIHDRLQDAGRTADPLLVMKGLIDGLGDHDPAYSRQDMQAEFAEFQAYTQQRTAEMQYADNPAFRKRADENLKKSQAVLDQNAEMAGVDVRPDGVQIQILSPGNGHVVGNSHVLTFKNLRVSLADGTLVQSSEPDQMEKLVTSDLLPVLTDVLRDMKVGIKCRIWLPADKAYGLTGKPPRIGPNQAVEYEFELVSAD
jgi:FKBP-type peptidyl-prolyl cis-trans isomerase FklB